jgi:steroid delta-isomerase-like uncharacterized protein
MLATNLKMLTARLVIFATIAFTPVSVMAQHATPVAGTEREAIADLVRRYYEIAASGELEALGDVLAPDFTIRNAPPGEDAGLGGLVFSLERARASRPDFAFRIDDLIVEGNAVVVRTTIGGTHLGDFFGLAPTGKWIEIPAIDLWHVDQGKLGAVWHFEDILGMMEQLGIVPADEFGGTPDSAATPRPTTAQPGATTDASQVAANVALARRFRIDVFGQTNLDAADAILASDFAWHGDVPPGATHVEDQARSLREAFPDLALTVDEVVAEGDRVATLWTLSGTHQGEYLGAPPTGSSVTTSGIDIYRIAAGRIAEIWTVGDDLGLQFQLGAFPGGQT